MATHAGSDLAVTLRHLQPPPPPPPPPLARVRVRVRVRVLGRPRNLGKKLFFLDAASFFLRCALT